MNNDLEQNLIQNIQNIQNTQNTQEIYKKSLSRIKENRHSI